ncbi:MAG: FAD-linked oxidase C-terminal domain-containing protein [Nocardioides sp.]|uniref:FAD-binding oxidoreductase n=1 Tax=Nocardioides sp. TaxID=35761 RepID=UPI0039E24B66
MTVPADLLERLRAGVGRFGSVSADPADLAVAAVDRSGARPVGLPAALVRAERVDDVRETLRIAHEHRVPVVPRGAGTGLAGGALAGAGSVVLDLSGLDRILAIDVDDQTATVQPGVITAELDRAAAAYGLRYTPDPASAAISTVGGNIATNAGGLRCLKYGVTREAVLGLEVVLADGTLIHTGRATLKGVAGLDLTSLFVGSEGTLGVVVGATVRLHPRPAVTLTAAATFPDVAAAAAACTAIGRARWQPSMLELLDHHTLAVIDRVQGTDYADRGGALVIAQADGTGAETEIAAIAELLGKEATWVEVGLDEAGSEALVAARRLALPSIEAVAHALIEDICVPRSRLPEAFAGVDRIARRHGVEVYSFAHAGDGNLHPIIGYAAEAPGQAPGEVPAEVVAAGDDIFALAIELGGTVTGEHGIGALKRDWLDRELGPQTRAVQRAIKHALDPHHILNPGKGL